MKTNQFINALTIDERYQILALQKEDYDFNVEAFSQFRSLKSILTNSQFSDMLEKFEYDLPIFSHVVSQNKDHYPLYEKFLNNSTWYQLYLKSVKYYKPKNTYEENYNLYYYLDTFIDYLKYELERILNHYSKYVDSKLDLKDSLIVQISDKIMGIAHKALIVELNTEREQKSLVSESSTERFHEFCEKAMSLDCIESFFSKYPVLCRQLATTINNSIHSIEEFFKRYVKHETEIQEKFNYNSILKLKDISLGGGDSHQNGRSVYILSLNNSSKLVYKPKNLKIVEFYNKTIDNINTKVSSSNELLDLKKINGIYFKDYAFEEFIAQISCEYEQEVTHYYKRFGQILALMHFLFGKDLHMENIIAHKDYPVIIDLETILQKRKELSVKATPLYNEMLEVLSDNVSYNGLLPNLMTHFNIDLSALSGGITKSNIVAPGIVNSGLDTMRIENHEVQISRSNNLVTLNSEEIKFEKYNNEIIQSFDKFYDFLLNNKDIFPKNLLNNQPLRVLLRDTQNYASLIEASYHPIYLRNSIYRENILMNVFNNEYQDQISVWEYKDLIDGDIPIFFNNVNSRNIYSSSGQLCAKNYFPENSLDFKKVESNFSLSDKEFQKALIMTKIYDKDMLPSYMGGYKKHKSHLISSNIDLLEEAKEIGDLIIEKAYTKENEASLFSFYYDSNKAHPIILDNTLYSGLAGVIIFFHYLHKVTNESKYYDFYKKLLFSAENNKYETSFDLFTGGGGLLYLYYRLYAETNDRKVLRKIDNLSEKIKSELEEEVTKNDWVGGVSSLANIYLNLYNINKNLDYLELAFMCLEKVKLQMTETQIGGFSHGYSSLAMVFTKAGYFLENEEYKNIGEKLIENDNSFFDTNHQAWVDGRQDTDDLYLPYWCHGSAGIGLSRLEILKYHHSKQLETDILLAKKHLESVTLLPDDTLCHGNLGKIEFFLSLSDYESAEEMIKHIVTEKRITGYYKFNNINNFTLNDYSLFTGLSGIGYQLLRTYRPDDIPNILILE